MSYHIEPDKRIGVSNPIMVIVTVLWSSPLPGRLPIEIIHVDRSVADRNPSGLGFDNIQEIDDAPHRPINNIALYKVLRIYVSLSDLRSRARG